MTEQRRPIFWFLWPRPDPSAPVDADYVQVRPVRLTPRGPIRWALLLVGTVGLAATTGSAILAALAAPMTVGAFLGAAVSATALVLILRGWVVGTYVNDSGATIDTLWRRRFVPWASIVDSPCAEMRVPLAGLPLFVPGRRVIVELDDGTTVPTHLYTTSPDLLGRPEAFDVACERWANWRDER